MKIDRLLFEVSKTKGDLEDFGFVIEIFSQLAHVKTEWWMHLDVSVHICGVFFTLFRRFVNASETDDRVFGEMGKLTFSFSTKSTKVVLSISTGWPCLSYKASTKWKKLDLRRLEGGCFSKCARASPTPLQAQAQKPAPSTKKQPVKIHSFTNNTAQRTSSL